VRVFKNRWFFRFAAKKGIQDGELKEMVNKLEAGQAKADLGGGVYKVRVARPGSGKSGGYRIIVFFRSGDRTFFVYGFAKSTRNNLTEGELKAYKEAAKEYLGMTADQLEDRIKHGQLVEL
jgi:hypothetical protein